MGFGGYYDRSGSLIAGEGEELLTIIKDFLDTHAVPSAEKSPWEYAFILYNAEENLYE